MLLKKTRRWSVFIAVIITLTVIFLALRNTTSQPQNIEIEIGEFIVAAVIDEKVRLASRGSISPNNSVYAQYSSENFTDIGVGYEEIENTPILKAWKYDGSILPAEKMEIVDAEAQDVFSVSFAVRNIENEKAWADIVINHPLWGGQAAHLILKFERDEWVIIEKDIFANWDTFPNP